MPKSKVRKKPDASASGRPRRATPQGADPSPTWYPIVMAGVLVIGLA